MEMLLIEHMYMFWYMFGRRRGLSLDYSTNDSPPYFFKDVLQLYFRKTLGIFKRSESHHLERFFDVFFFPAILRSAILEKNPVSLHIRYNGLFKKAYSGEPEWLSL